MFPNIFPSIRLDQHDQSYTKPVLIAILVLAAILRFVFLVELQANPMPLMVMHNPNFDQYNYFMMARDLANHRWLGSEHPGHSPVYSYLIAVVFSAFGADMNYVFIFQILFGIFAVYLFYRCSMLLFGNKNLALLTAAIAAMYSPLIYYECTLLREAVIAYTNLTAFYFFLLALKKEKGKNYFIAGMMTGLSLILRAGPLSLFALLYIFFKGGKGWPTRIRHSLLVLAGMAIIMAPLTIRNYVSGFKALTETSGPTLFWLGNSYDSPGIGLTYTETQKTLSAETQGKILKTIAVLWREIKTHPSEYQAIAWRKFKMLFNGYEIPANLSYDLFKEQSVILKLAVFNFALISPLALLGLILFWKKYPHINLLYIFIFSLTAFVFIFHIQGRYRMAFVPFYILAASYTLYWFWQEWEMSKAKPSLLWGAGAIFLILFIFTYPDRVIMNRYFNGGIRVLDEMNMGASYLLRLENKKLLGEAKKKDLEKALKYYTRALPRLVEADDKVSIYITQAMICRDLLFKDDALYALSQALAIDPQNPIALKEYDKIKAEKF